MAGHHQLDLYKGSTPADFPVYSLGEAAHYLRLPTATIRSWTVGRHYPTRSGMRQSEPVISVADPEGNLLSFRNLLELHVLSSMRRHQPVELRAIRRVVKDLRKKLRSKHPLLDRQMLTGGKDLLIERYAQLVGISPAGQRAMKFLLEMALGRIERDRHGIPIWLYPFTRPQVAEESPRLIAIDPTIRFGKPCLTGTRIPTAIIAERHEAGDSIALLAEDYGRSTDEIEEALRYES